MLFTKRKYNLLLTGPYGYRAPGSDYVEHVRRVSGAWGADSGDDASETSSICSERSLEVIGYPFEGLF